MRAILSQDQIHPALHNKIGADPSLVREVQDAIRQHPVVVVGMKQNPFCRKVCKLLDQHQISYQYLEYGSYFSFWRKRLALKMWTGFQTFPQVFVDGVLIGGYSDVAKLVQAGELSAPQAG